jgi:hypothetical protein
MSTSTTSGLTQTGAPSLIIPKKNVVLDATVLSTLMSCARLADFRFNRNFMSVNGKSNSLEVGSVVHKVLEVAYREMSKGFKREQAINAGLLAGELYANGCPYCADFTSTPDILKPKCGHSPDEYPGVKNSPVDSQGYLVGWKWALETARQYFEYYKNDFWVPLEVEVVRGAIVYEDDEIRILWKAKLDWIVDTNQGIFPVDHKTQKQKRKKIKLNNQFMGQCLVMNTRNMFVNNIGFQTTLKPEEKFTRELMSYSADALHEWQSEILPYYAYKLIEYTENNHWPANFTHCENKYGNCPFIDVCSSDRGMRVETLRAQFMIGPVWNPSNEITDGD